MDIREHLDSVGSWCAVQGVGSVGACSVMAFGCDTDYLEMNSEKQALFLSGQQVD